MRWRWPRLHTRGRELERQAYVLASLVLASGREYRHPYDAPEFWAWYVRQNIAEGEYGPFLTAYSRVVSACWRARYLGLIP